MHQVRDQIAVELDNARRTLERQKELRERDLNTQEDLDFAETAVAAGAVALVRAGATAYSFAGFCLETDRRWAGEGLQRYDVFGLRAFQSLTDREFDRLPFL